MDISQNSNVLFSGVSFSDLPTIEDMMNDRLTEETDYDHVSEQTEEFRDIMLYEDDVPTKFVDDISWITRTNLYCWHCSLSIMTKPAFLPLRLYTNGEVDTEGLFCSWNCAAAYAQKYDRYRQIELKANIRLIYHRICGHFPEEKIRESAPKTILKKYCGSSGISEKKYREKYCLFKYE